MEMSSNLAPVRDPRSRAVFTQDGLVVKEGDTLADGTILDEITESGGVAINFFGDVAFHGRTGGVKAVFTQNGLVAKEGDNLADGTTLSEIHQTGGVAINLVRRCGVPRKSRHYRRGVSWSGSVA